MCVLLHSLWSNKYCFLNSDVMLSVVESDVLQKLEAVVATLKWHEALTIGGADVQVAANLCSSRPKGSRGSAGAETGIYRAKK